MPNAWFARDEQKSLMFFAGIHVPGWQSVRKVKDGPTKDDLYGFLTTDPNELVKPIHKKAMPVLLLTTEETEIWMRAPWDEAKDLAQPLADDALIISSREPYGSSIVSKSGEPVEQGSFLWRGKGIGPARPSEWQFAIGWNDDTFTFRSN